MNPKILVVSNLIYNEDIVKRNSQAQFGGWLTMLASELAASGCQVGFVFRSGPSLDLGSSGDSDAIHYFSITKGSASRSISEIVRIYQPDVIHIEGTEYDHVLPIVNRFHERSIISIQGLISGCYQYYFGSVFDRRFVNWKSPTHVVSALVLFVGYLKFRSRAKQEQKALEAARWVFGRTDWDHAYIQRYASGAKYFHVRRLARPAFWNISYVGADAPCIFFSNASRAMKGFHTLLLALKILLEKFPSLSIKVSGPRPGFNFINKIGYGRLVNDFIDDNDLGSSIQFLGVLSEHDMAKQMASSSCTVIASSIENSPNTLLEAMLLGVPVVSSYVGGVGSMASSEEISYFRAGDPILLAGKVDEVLSNQRQFVDRAALVRERVIKDYNRGSIVEDLCNAYADVLN